MSAVRMCDRDGKVFSERADGWGTFTGSTRRFNERTGRTENVTETLDLCPDCNGGAAAPTAVASIAGVPEAERLAQVHQGQPAERVTEPRRG